MFLWFSTINQRNPAIILVCIIPPTGNTFIISIWVLLRFGSNNRSNSQKRLWNYVLSRIISVLQISQLRESFYRFFRHRCFNLPQRFAKIQRFQILASLVSTSISLSQFSQSHSFPIIASTLIKESLGVGEIICIVIQSLLRSDFRFDFQQSQHRNQRT